MSATAPTTQKKRALSYEKGLKRPKDLNAPKRPLTGYFQWAAENRERAQEECTSSNVAEVTKKLGAMWRSLPADERTGWEEKSKAQMDTYKKDFAEYKKTSKYENFEKSLCEYNIKMTYKPYKKDENMPKRPLSAYMLFAADERPKMMLENGDAKITEIMSLVAKKWKEQTDENKAPYNEKAKTFSVKHAETIETYRKSQHHISYLADKEAYQKRMATKRLRLMKQAGMIVDEGKGSGSSPIKKRVKSATKKKSSKKASGKKKSAKKSSAKKSSKKKASKAKKNSVAKKAQKAKAANTSKK